VKLAAICEPRAARLREVGERFPGTALSTSLEETLARPDVDAVVVATSATTHYDIASRCLEAGKHLLVEKPLATDGAMAADLVRLARERERTLMVGHTFLYNPAVQKLKQYVGDGTLGRIYYLYSRRTNLGPVRQDVNAIWDLAPHDISIFNHLLGAEPEWVSATGARLLRNRREDVGFITLGYPGGVVANIHVSWVDPNKVREIVVVGSERRVVFDDVSANEPIRLFEKGVAPADEAELDGDYPLQIRDGDIISPRIQASEPLKNQCRHFVQCVLHATRPDTPGEAGEAVVVTMESVARSVEQNGVPVPVRPATVVMPPTPSDSLEVGHGG